MMEVSHAPRTEQPEPQPRAPELWARQRPPGVRTVLGFIALFALCVYTGVHVEMHRMMAETVGAGAHLLGLRDESRVVSGFGNLAGQMLPPQISLETPLDRIEAFDADALPLFSHVEVRESFDVVIDYDTLEQTITVHQEPVLVQPLGYLGYVVLKMLETLEIALWGTLVAMAVSAPLALLSARNYAPGRLSYMAARSIVGFLRSVPELVSALFFVIGFGFGPVAGVLALGFHSAGFLGKFYAEDIENADRGPQEALAALGAGRLRVLRAAVIPQVLPQYVAYSLYILDRNVRMAAVIGLVGAGGIGQELKGRWDLFHYSHVTTILVVLFLTVVLLDQLSARVRARMIR